MKANLESFGSITIGSIMLLSFLKRRMNFKKFKFILKSIINFNRSFKEIIETLKNQLRLKLVIPSDLNMIEEESVFLVSNLYTKTKLGEDALVNISIERTKAGKIIGSAIIRSRAKEFAQILGDKIKTLVK